MPGRRIPATRFTHFLHPRGDVLLFTGIGVAGFLLQQLEHEAPGQRLWDLVGRAATRGWAAVEAANGWSTPGETGETLKG